MRWSATKPLCEVADQPFVDRGPDEVEIADVLGQGELGHGQPIADRPGLLLGDLRLDQIADAARRLALALDAGGYDLVIGTPAEPRERLELFRRKDSGVLS